MASQRKCRDVFCLLLFIVFCLGMLIVGAIGINYGKPQRLVYGTDYRGKVCGVDEGVLDRKYTAYPRTTEDFLVNVGKTNPLDYKFYGVCMSKCPQQLEVVCNYEAPELASAPYNQVNKLACLSEPMYAPPAGVNCGVVKATCWVTPQATASTFFRCIPAYNITGSSSSRCIFPANVTDAADPRCILAESVAGTTVQRPAKPNYLFDQMNTGRQLWGRWFGDLHRAWWVVLTCSVGLAVVLGFGFALFMKHCTGCMVWTTIVLVLLGLAALDVFFYYKGGILTWDVVPDDVEAKIKAALPPVTLPSIDTSTATKYLNMLIPDAFGSKQWDRQQAYRVVAYITSAVVVIVLCLVVALRRSIKTAISVIRLGSDAMRHMPLLLGLPPLAAIGYAAFLLWWIFIAASLATAGSVTSGSLRNDVVEGVAYLQNHFNGTVPDAITQALSAPTVNATLTEIRDVPVLPYLLIYHFFGLLWVTQFHNGVVAMTIAGAVAGWYFSQNESGSPEVEKRRYQRGRFPIASALGRTLRYYLGSVAFGSLLIALIQFVRTVFAYLQRQLQKGSSATGGPSPSVRFALCCIQCCLKCLQTCVEMVTRNAYIYVALKGVSFCAAGKRVFGLLTANAATLMFVNVLSEIIMFVAKVGIAAACGWGCYVLLDTLPRFGPGGADEVTSTWLVVLVTMFFGYAVAGTFMSIFDLAVDAILVCFVTDCEENAARGGAWAPVHVAGSKWDFSQVERSGMGGGGKGKDAPPVVHSHSPAALAQVAPSAYAPGGTGARGSRTGGGPRLV